MQGYKDTGAGAPDEAELLAALDADTGGSGSDWDPAPGDVILGRVVGFEHPRVPATDRVLPILVLETKDGDTVRVQAARAAIRGKLLDKRVQVGDDVAIRYDGIPEGRKWHAYRVGHVPHGERGSAAVFTERPVSDGPERSDSADLGLTAEATAGQSVPWSGDSVSGTPGF